MVSLLQASDQLDGLSYASRMCTSVTSELLISTQAPRRWLQKRRSESAGSKSKAQTQRRPSTNAADAIGTAIPVWAFSATADAAVLPELSRARIPQSSEIEGCLLLVLLLRLITYTRQRSYGPCQSSVDYRIRKDPWHAVMHFTDRKI